MIARLHFSKRTVERGWEEKNVGVLQDHAVIWLVLSYNKGQWLGSKEFLFIDSIRRESLSRWCSLKRKNG